MYDLLIASVFVVMVVSPAIMLNASVATEMQFQKNSPRHSPRDPKL